MKNNKVTLIESIERVMSMGDSSTRNNWINYNPQAGGYDSNPQWRGREVSITDVSPLSNGNGIIDRPSTEPFFRGADTRGFDPNHPYWSTFSGIRSLNKLNEMNKNWNNPPWWRTNYGVDTNDPNFRIKVLNGTIGYLLRTIDNNGLNAEVGFPPMLNTLIRRALQETGH
jgi:hypothetical protein